MNSNGDTINRELQRGTTPDPVPFPVYGIPMRFPAASVGVSVFLTFPSGWSGDSLSEVVIEAFRAVESDVPIVTVSRSGMMEEVSDG